jgi:hypothetical protein
MVPLTGMESSYEGQFLLKELYFKVLFRTSIGSLIWAVP